MFTKIGEPQETPQIVPEQFAAVRERVADPHDEDQADQAVYTQSTTDGQHTGVVRVWTRVDGTGGTHGKVQELEF